MAIDLSVTPGELEYQATQCFVGKTYKVFLAYRGASALGVGSTVGQWEAVEVAAANGYEAQEGTIAAGAYSSERTRYELGAISASFTGTGVGFTYDTVVVAVQGRTYPHSLRLYAEPQSLQSGTSAGFLIQLAQDD